MNKYTIFPFSFRRLPNCLVLMVNQGGEYHFIAEKDFDNFRLNRLALNEDTFLNLKSKQFVSDTEPEPLINLLATKYRTKKQFLSNGPVLHMMVTTVRCNHKCRYCHASSEDTDVHSCDMSKATARKCVDVIFQSPSPYIKIEFQGGEPLLNFDVVKDIISYSEKLAICTHKIVEFVMCTNLTLMDRTTAKYLKRHNVLISTSLDGPKHIHDSCRIMRSGQSSYTTYVSKLEIIRQVYEGRGVDALMTTSLHNLFHLPEVIEEYVNLGFNGIFIRPLNPFGFARREHETLGYKIEQYIISYLDALKYIIDINLRGTFFSEHNAAMLLRRILTPFSDGFMDLQFPSGAGVCGVIYDHNGNIYPCDEARMLARTGDTKFLMGNVYKNNSKTAFGSAIVHEVVNKSCSESIPACADCVYQIYCGSDPIRNYALYGDIVGPVIRSDHCKKYTAIFDYLFGLLHDNDSDIMDILWSWVRHCPLKDVRL